MKKVMNVFMDTERQKDYSTAEQIADVVYEAATDGQEKLRYPAGEDAKAWYAQRNEIGDEDFRKGINELFFGDN